MKKEKKSTKKSSTKNKKSKSTKSKKKATEHGPDSGLVIVEDSYEVDKDKINEERRAYLEEARSQEASD